MKVEREIDKEIRKLEADLRKIRRRQRNISEAISKSVDDLFSEMKKAMESDDPKEITKVFKGKAASDPKTLAAAIDKLILEKTLGQLREMRDERKAEKIIENWFKK